MTGTSEKTPKRWVIDRPRLVDLIEDVLTRRLTTVIAGPGFGKSTLLAAWAVSTDAYRYNASETDAELDVLARGLQNALGSTLPSIEVGGWDPTLNWDEQASHADVLAATVSESLGMLPPKPTMLVIDDLHEVPNGSASARALEGIVRQAPPWVHVVVGSRTQLPFQIERLRGRGEVLEVNAQMLAFTQQEVEELLQAAGLDPIAFADPLWALSGGWPAATRLAVEVLYLTTEERRAEVLESLTTTGGPLFSYLADEVLAAEPDAVRGLLRMVATLETFTPDLCVALGTQDAPRILSDLLRRGVLVEHAGRPDRYRLHALARAFCQQNLPLSDEEFAKVMRDAATWYEVNGTLDEALGALGKLGDPAASQAFLERYGEDMVQAGDAPVVLRAIGHLSDEHKTPTTTFLEARVLVAMGDIDGAGSILEVMSNSKAFSTAAAAMLAHVRWQQGRGEEAVELASRIVPEDLGPVDRARFLHTKAFLLHNSGDRQGALVAMQSSADAAEEADDYVQLAAALGTLGNFYSFEGDAGARDRYWERGFSAAERSGNRKLIERLRVHRAGILALVHGRVHEGLAEVGAALAAADLFSDKPEEMKRIRCLTLWVRAHILYQLGRLEEAMQSANDALEFVSRGTPYFPMIHVLLGHIHALRGNSAIARAEFDRALEVSRQTKQSHGAIHAHVGIAGITAHDHPQEALATARHALEELGTFKDGWLRAEAGWVELLVGDSGRAREIAGVAIEDARTGERWTLPRALELVALSSKPPNLDSLKEAAALSRELGDPIGEARATLAHSLLSEGPEAREAAELAQARLEALGVRVRGAMVGLLAALSKILDNSIEIRTLGTFCVVRGGRVASSEWASRKSRELLRILVARRGTSIHREWLMEQLWPGEEHSSLSNRFSVELSRARAALDPDRRFATDHFIRLDADSVALDVSRVDVDLERFIRLAERGLALAKEADEDATWFLEPAASLYLGDFLEDGPYEDWAVPAREKARILFMHVEEALAEIAERRGEHDAVVRHLQRVLERDPYDEQAHLRLIATSAAAGRHGESRRYYRIYLKRMEELSIEPLPFEGK